jgi:hypothetical protein
MIHLPASVRVYLCTSPCDMRRSFDGLHALVTGAVQLAAEKFLEDFQGYLQADAYHKTALSQSARH